MKSIRLFVLAGLVAIGLCQSMTSNCTEASFTMRRIADSLNAPVLLKSAVAPDNKEYLFIGQQTGEIVMWDISSLNSSNPISNPNFIPFVDLAGNLVTLNERAPDNETRGLLGLAFHRNFQNNGLFYVYYSANPPSGNASSEDPQGCVNRRNSGDVDCTGEQPINHLNRLEEWRWSNGNASMVRIMLTINQPFVTNNGLDNLLFDNQHDWLYLATGDGGCFRDPFNNAQNPDSLLGKLLQFNITGSTASCANGVNTFTALHSSCSQLASDVSMWAWGIRDPRGLAQEMDKPNVRHLIFGDDGEIWKEINIFIEADSNFGWDTLDGITCVDPAQELCGNHGPESNATVAPAALLNATNQFAEYNTENGVAEYTLADPRELVGGFQFMGSDVDCVNQAYIFGSYLNGSNLWYMFPANYHNATLDTSRCSSANFNFTNQGLPVFRVTLSLEGEPAGRDEYTLSQNIRSLGTTIRNDIIFVGTATRLRGDGTVWLVLPSSSSSSAGGSS